MHDAKHSTGSPKIELGHSFNSGGEQLCWAQVGLPDGGKQTGDGEL